MEPPGQRKGSGKAPAVDAGGDHGRDDHPTPRDAPPQSATVHDYGKYAIDPSRMLHSDRIHLRSLHSSGGIGEVWMAYDGLLCREVALKRLKAVSQASPANRSRFYREARITGQLDHPGIVPVYDFNPGEAGAQCFYTMRFVRGDTLRKVAQAFHKRRVSYDLPLVCGDLVTLLTQFMSVCNTMAFAHERGVIHRDVKGDNIIVGEFGEVVVLDWGLAKELADKSSEEAPEFDGTTAMPTSSETLVGERLGTPAYMAPEQALGLNSQVGPLSDVYGLGAILYELLTGQPPFRGKDPNEVMRQAVHDPPLAPSSVVKDMPYALDRVCMRALEKDPAQRPESARELGDEVRTWVSDLAERKRVDQERQRFFKLSNDLLAVVDIQGRIVQSNPAWTRMLGVDPRSRPSSRFIDYVAPSDHRASATALAQTKKEETSRTFDARLRTQGGELRWIHWNVRTLPGASQLYLVGRDLTELKESEAQFRGLVDSAPDATCVVDEDGKIILVNAELERMFGYTRQEVQGEPVELLLPASMRDGHKAQVESYVSAPERRRMGTGRNLQGRHKDGHQIRIEVSLAPVHTPRGKLVACSIRKLEHPRTADRLAFELLKQLPNALVVLDARGQITFANARAAQAFACEASDLQGAALDRFVAPAGVHELLEGAKLPLPGSPGRQQDSWLPRSLKRKGEGEGEALKVRVREFEIGGEAHTVVLWDPDQTPHEQA